jgi:hypothetical protein
MSTALLVVAVTVIVLGWFAAGALVALVAAEELGRERIKVRRATLLLAVLAWPSVLAAAAWRLWTDRRPYWT